MKRTNRLICLLLAMLPDTGDISIPDATMIQRWPVSLPSNENIGKPIA